MTNSPALPPYVQCMCTTYLHPILRVVQDGIEIRCKHCKQVHHITRETLEQHWAKLAQAQQGLALLEKHFFLPD